MSKALSIMAWPPKDVTADTYCRCPNPDCRSKTTFFSSVANLTKHLGQKPECRSFVATAALAKMDTTTVEALLEHGMGQSYTHTEPPTTTGTIPVTTVNDEEDNTSEGNFPLADSEEDMGDYEGFGFVNHDGDQLDLPGYQTTYTTRREVEIRLLKLCTEMEAPLYAFEEIMKWARHAYDMKYDFQPKQSTYKAQVQKLELWMGMENHRPKEIPVTLPSDKREEDLVIRLLYLISKPSCNPCWTIPSLTEMKT
jgi:hypothetical protein